MSGSLKFSLKLIFTNPLAAMGHTMFYEFSRSCNFLWTSRLLMESSTGEILKIFTQSGSVATKGNRESHCRFSQSQFRFMQSWIDVSWRFAVDKSLLVVCDLIGENSNILNFVLSLINLYRQQNLEKTRTQAEIFIQINVCLVTVCRRMRQHNGDWVYGPLISAFAFVVLHTGCRVRLSR